MTGGSTPATPRWEEVTGRLLASPRPAGTPEAEVARTLLRGHLESLGFTVEGIPFAFSRASARALPILAAGLGWLTLLQLPLLTIATMPGWVALAAWVGGLAGLLAIVGGVALGWTSLGSTPVRDATLVGTRDGPPVRRWILAHLDTAPHGPSWASRLASLGLLAAGAGGFLVLGVWRLSGPPPVAAVATVAGLVVMGSGLVARARRPLRTAGALDNGTGIGAALAGLASAPAGVGVLLTGAHEYGRVGARVLDRFHRERLAGTDVIELEALDGRGPVFVVPHGRASRSLALAVRDRLDAAGLPSRIVALPAPWLDAAALGSAQARVTVLRGGWRTLATLHTEADAPAGADLAEAARVGRAVV